MTTPFSRRYGFAPERQPTPRDEVPLRVRGEFFHLLDGISPNPFSFDERFKSVIYDLIRPYIWQVSKNAPPDATHVLGWHTNAMKDTINRCEWFEFYEICELTYNVVAEQWPTKVADFEAKANAIFAMDLLPWGFDDGLITPTRPTEITEIFEQAKSVLAEPRFLGPDEQFKKANQHLAKRPEPDTENCVKDAVGALEGVARILTNQPKRTLGQILKREPLKSMVPSLLLTAIEKVYSYRGDEPGVAHGQTGPSTIELEEADWVLSMCASTMVYLVKRFSS